VTEAEVALLGLYVAEAGFALSVAGIVIAVIALLRGNKNSSASLMVTLHDGFRQAWVRYLDAPEARKSFEFHELINLIEVAAATYREKSLVGASREMIEEYICGILRIIASNDDAVAQIHRMRHSPSTFKYIDRFVDVMSVRGLAAPFAKIRKPAEVAPTFTYVRSGGWLNSAWQSFQHPLFPGFAPIIVARLRARRLGKTPVPPIDAEELR